MLLIYSISGIMGKLASKESFLSFSFCLYYGLDILLLFLYALGWQQILGHMSLISAYANKAVNIVWACIWGILIFGETLTVRKIIGSFLVVMGVILYSISNNSEKDVRRTND